MPELIKKIFIFLIISGLCVSAFFVRFENFKKPTPRTTDEMVYYMMARQMDENFFDYNATNFALHDMVYEGKTYPEYFHKPLFKHPPFFVVMIMMSVKIFGTTALGAGFAPLFFGALSILLIYFLGKLVAGRMVGLIAAGLMWIDPVAIMSSQKVWMDAPLMFFMVLTVYGYWYAIKKKQDIFFLIGGLSAGTAFMIKYPGILTFFIMVLGIVMTRPKIFKNRYFQLSLLLPVVMSLPWAGWNYYVYGNDFITQQLAVHHFIGFFSPAILFVFILLIGMGVFSGVCFWNMDFVPKRVDLLFSSRGVFYLKMAGFLGAMIFAMVHLGSSLDFSYGPHVSWRQGVFSGEPGWFYLKRLLEYSFLYVFSYFAFFDPFFNRSHDRFILKVNAFFILLFFVIWKNFQCRYILPALPFLMLLSADYLWDLFRKLARIDFVTIRLFLQAVLLVLIVLAVSKTLLINQQISFTNDMCYF